MQIGENAVLLDLRLQQPGCLSGQEKIMELPIAAGGAVGRDHDLAGGVDTVEHPDIVPAIARQGPYHDGAADDVGQAGATRQVAQRLLTLVEAVLTMKTDLAVRAGHPKRIPKI